MNGKRLTRSIIDKKIAGVCGGIAEYFEYKEAPTSKVGEVHMDSTIVRLIVAILFFCGTIGLWAYILCALIIPKDEF